MPRKGKEPAGLRRYRLAQKRKRSGRKTRTLRAKPRRKAYTMARRRRSYGKRKRGGKMKSIPIAPILPVGMVVYQAYKDAGGLNINMLNAIGMRTTGYNALSKTYNIDSAKGFWGGEVAGIIVHKVANKTINKYLRKATMGYLVL